VPATDALRLLSWGIVLQGGAHMIARLLLAIEAERDFALVAGVSLLVNLALNLMWIPRFGIEGAALATLTAYGANLALYFVVAARRGRRVPLGRSVVGPLGAVVAAYAVTVWTRDGGLGLQVAAVAAAWVVALVVLRGVRGLDLDRIRKLARRDAEGAFGGE
jgi:O-antigen/teichoic acid export membrane protein